MQPRRGYQAAGRSAAIDQLHPGRRDDARQLGELVLRSDTHGLRRDWLAWHFMVDPAGPGWSEGRFKAALFYAYGCGWVTFLGWTYVVDPGPSRFTPAAPVACHRQAAGGAPASSAQTTPATNGVNPSAIQTKLADSQSPI